jgi:tRNA-binding protein
MNGRGLGRDARTINVRHTGADMDDLAKLDIRVARIVNARPLDGARNPAFVLRLDCGPLIGELVSTAQLTALYDAEELMGRLVLAVVNLPPRRVAGVKSQCLTLGVYNSHGAGALAGPVTLITPDAQRGEPTPGDRLG